MMAIVRSIFWCCFPKSSETRVASDKPAAKYQKVPNVPLGDNPNNWSDDNFEDEFEDFDDSWDLETASAAKGSAVASSSSSSTAASSSSSSSFSSSTAASAASAAKIKGLSLANSAPAKLAGPTFKLASPTGPMPAVPASRHASKPSGDSKDETSKPKPAAAAGDDVSKPAEDFFSDLGMAPTYKEPEKIKAAPRNATNSVDAAISHLDSLLDEAVSAGPPVSGWKNTDLGIELDEADTNSTFDLKQNQKKPRGKDRPKKEKHATGIVAVARNDVQDGTDALV